MYQIARSVIIMSSKTLTNQARSDKNERIAQTLKDTRTRRKQLEVKTYELKINANKLSKHQEDTIKQMCLEYKWVYNDAISHLKANNSLKEYDTKIKTVEVKLGKDSNEYDTRSLTTLPASMKQFAKAQINDSLKGLKSLKTNGRKVGSIEYRKQDITSLTFKQVGIDFNINYNNNTVKLSKIGTVKVRGLNQFSHDAEIGGRLKLLIRPTGYYLHVIVYTIPTDYSHVPKGSIVGLDMGIKTMLTTSDGFEYDCKIYHTSRLKKLQRKLSRQVKGSTGYTKTLNSIRAEHEKIANKKNDYANKVIHYLLNNYETIVLQDENVKGWHSGLFGKQVQVSSLGRLKSSLVSLKDSPRVIVVPRSCATTQLCLGDNCGRLNKMPLSQRTYSCDCGYSAPRDVHSANSMIYWAKLLDLL